MSTEAYRIAQSAVAELKSAIAMLLESAEGEGLSNAQIGRALGIYGGHKGHVGHIPRTLLAWMESEGIVRQSAATKRWTLQKQEHSEEPNED